MPTRAIDPQRGNTDASPSTKRAGGTWARTGASLLAGLVALAIVGSRAASPAGELPQPRRTLPSPEHVGAATQTELKARMSRHGEVMSKLVRAVVLLDRPTIRLLAGRIADEEIVAQPEGVSETRRRLLLPDEFFVEQSGLRQAAQQLAATAIQGGDNDAALADRFAAVARSCVACHSVYLHGRAVDR